MKAYNYFREGTRYNLIETDDDSSIDIIASFVVWAVKNNKKCIYYADRLNEEQLDYYLKENNLDLVALIGSGKLTIDSASEFYIEKRTYVRYNNIVKIVNNALSEGYSGVAVIADRGCFFESGFNEEILYSYEKTLNDMLNKFPISALSCYNIDRFGVDALFALTHLNPNFIYKMDNEVFVHLNDENIFSPKETLGIVYNYLKKRENIIRENRVYQFISKLSGELSYKKDESEIRETALNSICKSSYANQGYLVMLDNGVLNFDNVVKHDVPDEVFHNSYLYMIKNETNSLFQNINCIIKTVDDIDEIKRDIFIKHGLYSAITIPIRYKNFTYGYMWLATQDKYISFKDNADFLCKVCETIAQIILAYRRYKKIQDKLIQSRKMQALGELTGGIAHEFNNILTPILGYIQILKNKIDDPILSRYVDLMEDSARDGAKIVKRIQDFSRNKKKDREIIDIDRVIIQSVEITKPKWTFEAQIQKRFINVHLDLKSRASIEWVPTEVREVFVNIISNAVDAMPFGGVIDISSYNDGNEVVIKIKDNGIGMDREVRERIFEPFYTTKNERGNGLGLAIVYNILKEMGGSIDVESQIGGGTEFIIRIPKKLGTVLENTETKEDMRTRKLTVLVIDDQTPVAEAVSEMLKSIGHEVIFTIDDKKAIEIFESQDIDCIICDLAMPNYSGIELSQVFKGIKPNIPFILMTGWPGKLKAEDLNSIDEIVQKPFSIDEINEKICMAIKKEAI